MLIPVQQYSGLLPYLSRRHVGLMSTLKWIKRTKTDHRQSYVQLSMYTVECVPLLLFFLGKLPHYTDRATEKGPLICVLLRFYSHDAVEVVKALVSYYADVNVKAKKTGKTPLHHAALLERGIHD